MIVPMKRVYVVGRAAKRDVLLAAVRSAGVLHPEPLAGAGGDGTAEQARTLEHLERAEELLSPLAPSGPVPDVAPEAAAEETVGLARTRAELEERSEALERRLTELAFWGELRLADVQALRGQGLHVDFVALPASDLPRVRADLAQALGPYPGGRVLAAVASRGPVELPPSAEVLELPATDRPALRAERDGVARQLAEAQARLGQLRHLLEPIRARAAALRGQLELARVATGGLSDPDFFAVQGWIPADGLPALERAVGGAELGAVSARDPLDSELPPTLLRPPRWASSVSGLMQVLGLSPGYREADVSAAFMVAIPLFAAILISDAGYGALLLLGPLLAYRKAAAALGRPLTHFVMIMGAAAVFWGALTGSFFGVDLAEPLTGRPPLIVVNQEEGPMQLLMRLSFTIGVVHLSLGQAWKALLLWPTQGALARLGWALFLWGMYGVVAMFVLKSPMGWSTPWPWLLAAGAALAVLFGAPDPNPLKRVALGLANFPLSALSTFSDIMSYVRLMAVGLAGSVLAVSFNALAGSAPLLLKVPILLFGHGLNVGLCLIALFAHGVRLNVLEFSNNFGLEWGGYPYVPFQAPSGATTQQRS